MKHLMLACALLLAPPALADEMISAKSPHDVKTTLDQVEAAAKAQDFKIVARVGHAAAAKAAGLELHPTALLIFGKPQGGTPVMACDQRAGLDLPLRALAWQDASGQVWLGMTDPAALKARYDLTAGCDAPIAAMQGATRKFVAAGVKP